jgi:hypothetical protein
MKTMEFIIADINQHAEQNKLFWVCAIVKDCLGLLEDHVDQLNSIARMVVEHYLEEKA